MKSGVGIVDNENFFCFWQWKFKCTYNCSFIKINEANGCKNMPLAVGMDCSWLRTIDLETAAYLTISFLNILSCLTPSPFSSACNDNLEFSSEIQMAKGNKSGFVLQSEKKPFFLLLL